MRRLRRILLWVGLALFLVFLLAGYLVVNTSLSERMAEQVLSNALKANGGSLVIGSSRGSLAGGLDLEGLEVRVPPGLIFKARHLHLRLSPFALLSGTLLLKDLTLEDPTVEILLPKPGAEGRRAVPPPSWLRVYAPRISISGGVVVVREANAPPEKAQVWSGLSFTGDVTWFMQRLKLKLASFQVKPPSPIPSPLNASGTADFSADGASRMDLLVRSPRSSVKVLGGFKMENKGFSYHASLGFSPLALREEAIGWSGSPDLLVTGTASVEGDLHRLAYHGDVKAEGFGPVASSGRVVLVEGGVDCSGTFKTPGARLTPFWKTPSGREASLAGAGTWSLSARHGGLVHWQAEATLGPSVVWGISLDSARITGTGSDAAVSLAATWVAALSGPSSGTAHFDLAAGSWKAEGSAKAVRVFDLLHALGVNVPLPSTVHPPDGAWDISRCVLSGDRRALSLEAQGKDPTGAGWTFSLDPMADRFVGCTIACEGADPSSFGLLPGHQGQLSGRARYLVAGTSHGELGVEFTGGQWAGVRIDPFKARLRFAPGEMTLESLALHTSVGDANLGGTLRDDGHLDGPIRLAVPDLTLLNPLLGETLPSGALNAVVHVSGVMPAPKVEGEFSIHDVQWGQVLLKEAGAKGRWDADGADSDLALTWKGLVFSGQNMGAGTLKLAGNVQDLHAELEMEAGAERTLFLRARGRVGRDELDLDLKDGRLEALGRKFTQDGQARVTASRKFVSWSGFTLAEKESSITISGRLDTSGSLDTAPISGTLTAKRFPLGLLPIPRTAGKFSGFINARLSWGGTVDKPTLQGGAELAEGGYQYADSDRVISPITASFKADLDRLDLTEVHAATPDGGKASGSGFVRLRGFWPEEFRLEAQGTTFPFIIGKNMDGVADFTAVIHGSFAEPVLEGSARIKKGRIQLPELDRSKALPETVRFINAPPGSPYAQPQESGPSLVGPLRGALKIETSGGLWISSKNLLAELAGAVTVRFTPQGPAVGGSLEVLQGRFLFEGKKFELHDSRVSFDGTTSLIPYLAVRATYTIHDTDVEVQLTGPANKPQLTLTSSPPLDQSDILSLLIVGRTSKDLRPGDSQNVSSSAAGALALYGATPILEGARETLGLDSMSIGAGASPQVAFSKTLSDKTVLEYQQTFGALPEWWVNLRYRINRSYSVQTGSNSRGTTGIDLFWERRY